MATPLTKLRKTTLHAILAWWAEELGVNVPELMARADGVTLSPSRNMPGVFLFRRGGDMRIAAGLPLLETIQEAIIGHTHARIFAGEWWREHLPELCGAPVGPAHLYYLDDVPKTWSLAGPRGVKVRGLAAMDATPFRELWAALDQQEREESGVEFGPRPMWGAFEGDRLLAVAAYDSWPGRIAHVGVAVHPEARGRKLGQCVARAAARGAIMRRRIVQYRALSANGGAVGIANSLGLELFAETLFVRPAWRG